MNFNLQKALAQLRQGAAFQVANEARPGNLYLFNTLLPEVLRNDYYVSSGSMTVRATMAGLVGMDSPYPEGGTIEIGAFSEETAKIANRVRLPEKALRDLHQYLAQIRQSQGDSKSNEAAAREALNFVNKLIVEPHLDTMEWLRGQALVTGQLDWVFNKKRLLVDYGIPSKYYLTHRAGNDGYGGSASKLWQDIRAAKALLRNQLRAVIAHSDTIEMILANSANNLLITNFGDVEVSFVQQTGTLEQPSTDPRNRISLIRYDLEGEILDLANPGKTLQIPFMPRGALLFVANNFQRAYVIGAGTTPPPENVLGYTHIAPTIEGDNTPGRWADVRTPDGEPWALESRGVTNGLPVLEATNKLVVATTDMV